MMLVVLWHVVVLMWYGRIVACCGFDVVCFYCGMLWF